MLKYEQVKLQAQAGQLEENKGEGENKAQKKEKDEVVIPAVVTLLQTNNIPLINNNNDRIARMGNMDIVQLGGAGKKGEEGKAEGSRKKYVKSV